MSSRKPPSPPDDWDDFDIPTWDDPSRRTSSRDNPAPSRPPGRRDAYPDPLYDDYEAPAPPRQSGRSAPYPEQPPRLSSRVPTRTTRPSRQDPYRDPYSDNAADFGADPFYPAAPAYDTPPRAAAPSPYDRYADPALDAGWAEAPGYENVPAPRHRSRQGSRPARPSVTVPRPAISDTPIATVVGAAILSLLVMAGVIWYSLGDVAPIIPWHLDAAGNVDRWASNGALWRIPFGSFMALAIGLVLGWFLWKRDRFAARFLIVSMCLVQVLAWVAVIDQLW